MAPAYEIEDRELIAEAPGLRVTIPPGRPHRVAAADDGRCRFVIVQGVGTYDYLPD